MAQPRRKKYIHFPTVGLLAFVVLAFLFSVGREPVATFASRILTLTGEVTVRKKRGDVFWNEPDAGDQGTARRAGGGRGARSRPKRPARPRIDYSNPVVANLPKTPPVAAPRLAPPPSAATEVRAPFPNFESSMEPSGTRRRRPSNWASTTALCTCFAISATRTSRT